MAVANAQGIAVGTTAVAVATASSSAVNTDVVLINQSGTQATVFLGDADVTTGNGARWTDDMGKTFSMTLDRGEVLYAIVASGSQTLDRLQSGA
jgi:hypothetical protein